MKLFLWKWITAFSLRFIVLLILFLQLMSFNQYGVIVEAFKLHTFVSLWINFSLKHFKNEPFFVATGAGGISNLKTCIMNLLKFRQKPHLHSSRYNYTRR